MCVNIYLLVLALFLWWLDLRIHTLVTESVGGVGGGMKTWSVLQSEFPQT